MLSKEAINIIDNGHLLSVSKCFGKSLIDLDGEIFEGVYAKYILDCAVRGSLDKLLGSVHNSKVKAKGIRIIDLEVNVESLLVTLFHLRKTSWKWMKLLWNGFCLIKPL